MKRICSETPEKPQGHRKTGAAYRRMMTAKKDRDLRKLIALPWYDPRIGYLRSRKTDADGNELTYICYPKNSNCQRYIKQLTNRKIRQYKGELPSGNYYRRLVDYWHILY